MIETPDQGKGAPWWAIHRIVRLTALLVCLGVLIAYVCISQTRLLGFEKGSGEAHATGVWARGCPSYGAPQVTSIDHEQLVELRTAVRGAMAGEDSTLYEVGVVNGDVAWSDNSPQPGGPLFRTATLVPGGYEMRWWARNKDDVVVDVFMFSQTAEARDFLNRASSAHCRSSGKEMTVSRPLGARGVSWINPDDVSEADIYFRRARRVYRIADVPVKGLESPEGRRATFNRVENVACALTSAACGSIR